MAMAISLITFFPTRHWSEYHFRDRHLLECYYGTRMDIYLKEHISSKTKIRKFIKIFSWCINTIRNSSKVGIHVVLVLVIWVIRDSWLNALLHGHPFLLRRCSDFPSDTELCPPCSLRLLVPFGTLARQYTNRMAFADYDNEVSFLQRWEGILARLRDVIPDLEFHSRTSSRSTTARIRSRPLAMSFQVGRITSWTGTNARASSMWVYSFIRRSFGFLYFTFISYPANFFGKMSLRKK